MSDLCTLTDLPASQCGCQRHRRPGSTVISITALERLAGRPLPEYRARVRPPWRVPDPESTTCDHQRDGLCKPCELLLDGLLADLPHLVEDLGFAMRKDCRFAPHGHRRGDTERPDESPLPWNPAAAEALGDLHRFMAESRTDRSMSRRRMLARLSDLARHAHRILDRPKDRVFTMCPVCRTEIQLKDTDGLVVCPVEGCSYSAEWRQHQRDLLDTNGDALLTISDLVLVLTNAGEPMTRARIEKMVTRHGLPREEIALPRWKDKRIVTEAQWVYRVRDVRDMQAQIDTRKPERRGTV